MSTNGMCMLQTKDQNPSNGVQNIRIIVRKSKRERYKKRKKQNVYKISKKNWKVSLSNSYRPYNSAPLFKKLNMAEMSGQKYNKLYLRNSDVALNSCGPYRSDYIINVAPKYPKREYIVSINNSLRQTSWEIYRCQLNTKEESCCCSCNSDAMFEVMKSLYDCYKKKNCDHCNCILCAHLPREERRLGEKRKSDVHIETISSKEKKKQKLKKIDTGLPLELKTTAKTEKSKTEESTDFSVPFKEKTRAEKEKNLKKQSEIDIALSKKRTPSEKIIKAQEAGLLTPLHGKTPKQKENILRGLAMHGLPLPQAKTPSEKKLTDKIRKELGLPPEPKMAEKEKYNKAQTAGFIKPLEGKTSGQKEKILRGLANFGIPLPEGRTPSEKALIDSVKRSSRMSAIGMTPSEKLRKRRKRALSSGKIKKLDKKTAKNIKEGKGPSDECICDILISESERLLLKPKLSKLIPHKITSEKLKSAKADGFLTPLTGKTSPQKEKILKGLAMHGLPLPEGKTASEKKLINKVRADMGLPPKPKTPSAKEKYAKAQAAGIVTPLEGKTASQKEKVLSEQAKMGLLLPEGRTPSEKALIKKIKTASIRQISSDKLRKAKSAELLKTLQGKTPEQKEKILRGRFAAGLPLPKGKTPSEKEIIKKVRAATGYVTPVGKIRSTATIPSIRRLDGKTPSQKEKILKSIAKQGLPLPEGKTLSEKALISKIKATHKAPSSARISSEKLRKAKATGLLTPLSGKTPSEKEKVLKKLAKSGIPLPEGKTLSDKELIKKVRRDMGLLQKSKSSTDKIRKAYAAGLITPLDRRTPSQKEKILKKLAEAGAPLPEGRTSSEKILIKKVQADALVKPPKRQIPSRLGPPALSPKKRQKLDNKTAKLMKEGKGPSDECLCSLLTPESERAIKIPLASSASEKLRKEKVAELSTQLVGKTPAQKEKSIKDLVMKGFPLPEGKTASEKKLINKVRNDLGLPPEPQTPSERKKYNKALAAGAIVPLEGKTSAQKNKILQNQAKLDIPLPKGRTRSEKAIIDNIKKMASLTPKRISSRKMKIKSNKIGDASVRRSAKSIGGIRKSGGIVGEFQDILKTTTCDRGCGCDKKKIRFKHSYVKIKVTSPDFSSLCPCPDECIPGIKSGVLTDSEGIRVTVGRAVGVPSFSVESSKNNGPISIYINENFSTTSTDSITNNVIYSILGDLNLNPSEELNNMSRSLLDVNCFEKCLSDKFSNYSRIYNNTYPYIWNDEANTGMADADFTNCDTSSYIINRTPSISISIISKDCSEPTGSSFESIYLIKTESSLSFPVQSRDTVGNISVLSLVDNIKASHASHYLYYSQSETSYSDESAKEKKYFTKLKEYSITKSKISNRSSVQGNSYQNKSNGFAKNTDLLIFRVSGTNINDLTKIFRGNKRTDKPILIINDLNSEHDITAMVDEVISNKLLRDISSVFIIVASHEDMSEYSSHSSSVYIHMPEIVHNWNNHTHINDYYSIKKTKNGFKMNTKGKTLHIDKMKEKDKIITEVKVQTNVKNGRDQFQNKDNNGNIVGSHIASVDTTCDRPCCCQPKKIIPQSYTPSDQHVASVYSEFVIPMIMKQGDASGLNDKALMDIPGLRDGIQSVYGSIQAETTSVRSCIIPPYSGRDNCHDLEPSSKNVTSIPAINQSSPSRPFHHKQTNVSSELTYGDGGVIPGNISTVKPIDADNTSCPTCDRLNFTCDKKKSCFCGEKEKKIKLEPKCPCQVYNRPSSPERMKETKPVACQHDNEENRQNIPASQDACTCKHKKKRKKNIKCECPEVPELDESELLESALLIDDKLIRKMQSDLTQTTSGFKLHTQKKAPAEGDMNYEDIINYYKNFLEEDDGDTRNDRQGCDCEGASKKAKKVHCVCPFEPPPPEPVLEIPLKGLKFHIGGKGSGSKGLSGICCFDMLHENRRVVKFKSINHLS